jgi:pimeloyl-ACP methyl ester carboxylesterase
VDSPLRSVVALDITAADGVELSALRYGASESETAVVFAHGFTGTQRNRKVVDLAQTLAAGGLAVYTLDFRGHGASSGRSTLGDREVHDLEAVVAVARERSARVVTVGASMGGFVTLRHAGLGGDVDGVISISSPAVDREPALPRARVMRSFVETRQGRWLLDRYGTRVGEFALGVATPLEVAPLIAPIPVVIVHGARDRYVPMRDADAIYERLGDPKQLVKLVRFGHGEAGFDAPFAVLLRDLVHQLVHRSPRGPPDAVPT